MTERAIGATIELHRKTPHTERHIMAKHCEHLYIDEKEAHMMRRNFISRNIGVSLIAFDPSRDVYTFDTYHN